MATQAHCAYCFETLAASLEKRPGLTLAQVEALWNKYNAGPTTTNALETPEDRDSFLLPGANKPAAMSRLLAPSPATASSSSVQSATSTPSGLSEASSAISKKSSQSSIGSKEEAIGASPLFVTWNTVRRSGEKRLRGCIGTFQEHELDEGLKEYALTSAFEDTRFSPLSARELPTLECAVTLLTNFESVSDSRDWSLGTHGLRISFMQGPRRYGATYLPDVAREQGWTKEKTLISLMQKAGWHGREADWEKVKLDVVRYQGRKVDLGYGDWKEWRDWVEEEMEDEE